MISNYERAGVPNPKLINTITMESGKLEQNPNYWSLAFTGHTNIEKCYGEIQVPDGFSYNCSDVNGIGEDSANKLYRQIKKAIEKFIESNPNLEQILETREEVLNGERKEVPFRAIETGRKPRIIVGMARGVDEIAGIVAMDMGLVILCCVPNTIQWHSTRPPTNKGYVQAREYNRFLNYPKSFWIEVKKTYSIGWPFANFARNAAMVDLGDKVLSFKCYDSTGTDHCIKLAKKAGKYAGNIPKE